MIYQGNSLYHHGILGMKWGVRRYQNYDGSYTQAGVKRYQNAQSDYESAKESKNKVKASYKEGTASKAEYKKAASEVKSAKKKMSQAYDKLELDKRADEGKKLYQQGKTIRGNHNFVKTEAAILAGSNIAAKVLADSGHIELAVLGGKIAVGATAVNAVLSVKANSENKKLRAYYAH